MVLVVVLGLNKYFSQKDYLGKAYSPENGEQILNLDNCSIKIDSSSLNESNFNRTKTYNDTSQKYINDIDTIFNDLGGGVNMNFFSTRIFPPSKILTDINKYNESKDGLIPDFFSSDKNDHIFVDYYNLKSKSAPNKKSERSIVSSVINKMDGYNKKFQDYMNQSSAYRTESEKEPTLLDKISSMVPTLDSAKASLGAIVPTFDSAKASLGAIVPTFDSAKDYFNDMNNDFSGASEYMKPLSLPQGVMGQFFPTSDKIPNVRTKKGVFDEVNLPQLF
jgi:hypothetical protein